MAEVIAQRELRNQNAAIMAAVAAGQGFVITRNGTPVAELRPITSGRRTFVPRAEIIEVAANNPHIDAATFRADLERLVDQGL
ncbi:MAG TPA: type II toxin-antitoxin system prevent-host-death family antitoxin [Solirubrobacterales bacterium]|jgi:prevent-host-death family protein|nr:type II toxin-antitoxin system prevent-host-death family antitoxin [Solirubrobacterales bacterium]